MSNLTARRLAVNATVAALYTIMSYFSGIFGLAYGPIQCRFSEALCVLPFFFPYTAWGLFVGCFISNLMSAFGVIDIVFGSLATLTAGLLTARVRHKALAPLPPVLINAVVIGAVIAYSTMGMGEGFMAMFLMNALSVGVGQAIACYGLGTLMLNVIPKSKFFREMIYFDRPEILVDGRN